jgi:hypothetical protein
VFANKATLYKLLCATQLETQSNLTTLVALVVVITDKYLKLKL